MDEAELEARARRWMADDVAEEDRAAVGDLLRGWTRGDAAAGEQLRSRFSGPLAFGTAGLRGRVEAGESRMNRATVIRATAGLADCLLDRVPDAAERGVVLGRDARRGSAAFQEDAARVLAGRGLRVWWLEGPGPTPVVPFGVRRLGAAAGVMITASHNPPADNGYKVYWHHGAQIAPPVDADIAARISAQPGARHVVRAPPGERVVRRPDLAEAYLEALDRVRLVPEADLSRVSVAYTALHGVAGATAVEAFARRGVRLHVVEEQQSPDPEFPTVPFPNPEEPGAFDLALAKADSVGADLVLAHDPDGDRLGAMVRGPAGWVRLSGDEIGILLARHLVDHDDPGDPSRLVVNTVVSSRLLARMAGDLGVRYAESLTGFKHIAERMRELEEQEGLRALIGYEEALGYAVSREVHDKDGISAALVLTEAAAVAAAEGRSLLDLRDAIGRAHGLFVGRSRSVVRDGLHGRGEIADAMARLRETSLAAWAELGVSEVWDLKSGLRTEVETGRAIPDPSLRADLLVLELDRGGRVCVRPSGTEPKLKLYLEREVPWPADRTRAEVAGAEEEALRSLEATLVRRAGLERAG